MGRPKSTRKCIVEGCGKPHYGENLCRMHFTRMKRNGSIESKYDKKGYRHLGGVIDTGPGRRGSLAVNIINDIKFKARKRGKEWHLSHEEAFTLITSKCKYCPFTPTWPENRVGIDRVDNNCHYVSDNCVPCCFKCNSSKNDMSLDEFKSHVKNMYETLFINNKERISMKKTKIPTNASFQELGEFFGYPQCCIHEFLVFVAAHVAGFKPQREKRKLYGSGYVPCRICNQKTEKQLIQVINKNRQYAIPFRTSK